MPTPDSTNAAHEKGEPGGAEADTLRAYLRQLARVPLLTTQEERLLCEQIETARVALAGALLAAPSSRHRFSGLAKEVLEGTMDPDVLLQAPDGRQLDRLEIADAAHLLALACRSGAELEHIDHELANNVTPDRRLELRQEADEILASLDRTLAEVPVKSTLVESLVATYAVWWIRQAITGAIAGSGRTIRLPAHKVESMNRIAAARRALPRLLGREPTIEEIATLDSLNERERRVLELRHGFANGREHTIQEIADRMGCSPARVRQLERLAINRLRRRSAWNRPMRTAA